MDLTKSRAYFSPEGTPPISIIGCGALGSMTAELLARFGIQYMHLQDFDHVEPKNLANQMYQQQHIGMNKAEALKDVLTQINPDIKITLDTQPWTGGQIKGILIMTVDTVKTRKEIIRENKNNLYLEFVTDLRVGLTTGQAHSRLWTSISAQELEQTLDYTDEEVKKETPVTACGVEIGIPTTGRLLTTLAVQNLINYLTTKKYKKLIIADVQEMHIASV